MKKLLKIKYVLHLRFKNYGIGTRSYQGLLFGPLEFRVKMGTRS